ncbi:50S ribosomal protein L6 [Candidatus Wirthbacteria bacterium CG2_30_54_11]|uniref:Large ribosomal subunit protein uL6 n=1 Tax=Candidatus Wirthbacteria bacterium CG2_30_54_11 TaxID=1817892 RepID=A0A1J5J524_9BACT|nr:ribosomal protein L6 [uncultured bacterium]OIQ00544.1 MAG: 50S ribosomal protein L6 [Candidatus Wirthbacteria bacterium CG2_30_54_11]
MSRIGRQPITIPPQVEVTLDRDQIAVKGKLGTLTRSLFPELNVKMEGQTITVERKSDSRRARAMHGLARTLIANMIQGVDQGFSKTLDMVGVGYRTQAQGDKLTLNVGYSHQIVKTAPAHTTFQVEAETSITITGIDKQVVGQIAAEIRATRKPEPYKGKGIKYRGEVILRKAGKKGTT